MQISGILCSYKEYRRGSLGFVKTCESEFEVNSYYIQNMIDSSTYFSHLGGYMNIEHKPNRRFGLVPTKLFVFQYVEQLKKFLLLIITKLEFNPQLGYFNYKFF